MDRDNRYERIKLAYDLLVHGTGSKTSDLLQSIQKSYEEGITDEFINPISIQENDQDIAHIENGDAILFYNFRTDRPRQLTTALSQKDFPEYELKKLDLHFATMTTYDESFEGINVVFTKDKIAKTIGEVVANEGLTQLRIAETEKYPHVTFFFSGGREQAFAGEERILIPSPKVATYDLQPQMSAEEITNRVCEHIEKKTPDFICLNYANTDMVGHTGIMEAAIKATETVDKCLKRAVTKALEHDYEIVIIADHGNSDVMRNPDGSAHTAHTTNLVPLIYVSNSPQGKLKSGRLGDIAPTLLLLMHISQPSEMTGKSLVE
jgi:2,3-bisphosphoglycerate-independent phosphoglycerate mutase